MSRSPDEHGRSTGDAPVLPPALARAYAPLDARALAAAVGITSGMALALLTAFHVIIEPRDAPDLRLLAHYFPGYAVAWHGILVGLAWGAILGGGVGLFIAVVGNGAMRLRLLFLHGNARLQEPFLDDLS